MGSATYASELYLLKLFDKKKTMFFKTQTGPMCAKTGVGVVKNKTGQNCAESPSR